MSEQTVRNISYLAGLEALDRLSALLGWSDTQLAAARAALVEKTEPTLAPI